MTSWFFGITKCDTLAVFRHFAAFADKLRWNIYSFHERLATMSHNVF